MYLDRHRTTFMPLGYFFQQNIHRCDYTEPLKSCLVDADTRKFLRGIIGRYNQRENIDADDEVNRQSCKMSKIVNLKTRNDSSIICVHFLC